MKPRFQKEAQKVLDISIDNDSVNIDTFHP